MPALVAGIHVLLLLKTWMAGTSPAMTKNKNSYFRSNNCRIRVVIRPVGETISFMMVK